MSTDQLPAIVEKMTERLSREVPRTEAAELWTATHILMGLRYEPGLVELMLRRVRSIMQESATYQTLRREAREEGLAEGREEGREKGKQELLLLQGARRFGAPSSTIRGRLLAIHGSDVLDDLSLRVLDVRSWDELLQDAP